MNSTGENDFPVIGKWLGYTGAIPFVMFAVSIVVGLDLGAYGIVDVAEKLLVYAAVIISFIGAVHWGVALNSSAENRNALFVYSVLPALVAWVWTFLPVKSALFGMALTIAALYFIDRHLLTRHVPSAYMTMRLHLTIIVGVSLLLAAIRA